MFEDPNHSLYCDLSRQCRMRRTGPSTIEKQRASIRLQVHAAGDSNELLHYSLDRHSEGYGQSVLQQPQRRDCEPLAERIAANHMCSKPASVRT